MIKPEHIERLHEASLAILEKTGVVMHHEEAREALKKHGCAVDGERVLFPGKVLMGLVGQAPESFSVTPYNESRAVAVGAGQTHWATGGGASNVLEPDSSHRPATFRDFADFLKIAQATPRLDVLSTLVVQSSDLPVRDSAALQFFHAAQLSDKVLVAVTGERRVNEAVLGTAAALFGGAEELARRPRLFAITSTLSPLRLDHPSLEGLLAAARLGQPVAVTPCTMAGSTGPMTLAGSIAVSNAETLAGVALAQAVRPGAPVLYGCQSTTSDPGTASISIGAPEQALFIAHGGALAKFYRLPCRGGGLLTDADRVSAQSGWEAMLTGLATRRAGYDLVLHGAGIVCGYAAMSFEQYLVDLEILGVIETLDAGIAVDEASLALDVVAELGADGGYLTHRHTTRHCRRAWRPALAHRGHLGGPAGHSQFNERLAKEKKRLLEAYRPPDLPPSAVRDMRDFLRTKGIEA